MGLALGIPARILVSVLSPIAQAEGRRNSIKASLIAIAVFDILLDLAAVALGYGMFGMGLATSISEWIGLLIIVVPMIKSPLLKLSVHIMDMSYLISIFKIGTPKFIRRVCNTMRPIFLNSAVIMLGGDIAMSAMSIRNNVANVTECFGEGLASTVMLLTALYVGERSRDALTNLRKSSLKVIYSLILVFSALIIIFAKPIAGLYVKDNPEVMQFVVTAIRCMAVKIPLGAMVDAIQSYWQGIGKLTQANIMSILNRFVYLILSVIVLGYIFGINGVWAAFPASSILTLVTFAAAGLLKGHKLCAEIYFPIPEDCDIPEDMQIVRVLDSVEEATEISQCIHEFCISHGIDRRRAMYVALCFEEMACNIVLHGFTKKKGKYSIDVFVAIIDDHIILRLRDNCVMFDVVEKYKCYEFDPEHPEKCIGIRSVMKIAENVEYINTFGTNNLIITI